MIPIAAWAARNAIWIEVPLPVVPSPAELEDCLPLKGADVELESGRRQQIAKASSRERQRFLQLPLGPAWASARSEDS